MNSFILYDNEQIATLYIPAMEPSGIHKVAASLVQDLSLVTEHFAPLVSDPLEVTTQTAILAMTLTTPGTSKWLDFHNVAYDIVATRRESYQLQIIDNPFPDNPSVTKALLVIGSEKRGTIYGLYHISELCGVSPLVYFGDVTPAKRPSIILDFPKPFIAKEPSVEYRGFFINDEWPAFGKWCTEQFGGINAKAYDKIFQLLLRLKGNYMWPAMWRSSFSEDGPGLENAKLADEYGVIMGTSHHEPLCRAGVEWQQQYQKYSTHNHWSILSNEAGITKFWKDGLLRNREFENLYTIGMRGEDDSKLLPETASLGENIEVVKKSIRIQHKLLAENINADVSAIPQLLAIYKEVEDFYYGDSTCEGLRNWDELRDVIFLLSDDNYGNLRGLPNASDRNHPGGFGMYYHFDYHGAPVSYEWQNSTTLVKTWEQMTTAYEYGVRKLWIVNVGDLKGVEYPLTYFMNLAYDYDKWGVSNLNSPSEYASLWIQHNFPLEPESNRRHLLHVLEGFVKWNAYRRPEAQNEDLFQVDSYHKIKAELEDLFTLASQLHSLVEAPIEVQAGENILRLYAGAPGLIVDEIVVK